MSNKNRPSGIARNAIANWLAFLFVAGVSFFLSPFIVRHLGNTAYGVWSLLVSLVGYLGLLDFGVRGAVTRYVAHHHAIGDSEECSSIVSAGAVLFGLLGILAVLLSGVFAFFAPTLFNIPDSLINETRVILVVGGCTVAVTLVGGVFAGVITALERFDISSGIEIIVTAIRTIMVVIALREGYGLVSLAYIHFATSVLIGIVSWANILWLYPELRLQFRGPLSSYIRRILSFSAFLSLLHVFGILIYYTDALVIAVFLPISAVTFFAIASNLCDYAAKIAGALSKIMLPRVSALISAGSKKIEDEILSAARVATLATASIAITFWLRGESFIDLWMGADYGPTSGSVLQILAFVVWLGGARTIAASAIIGANKHRLLVPVFAFEAVFNLALSAALASPFGLIGVALGTLIPSLVVSLKYIPQCLSKSIGVPVSRFYRNAWILPTVACIPFALANYLFEYYFPAENLAVFFMQVISILPLVPAVAMILCLTPAERQRASLAVFKVAIFAHRSVKR